MNCVPKSNDVVNSKTLCRLRFSKSGAHLAVPANGSVTVLARDSWQEVISLTVPDLKEGEIFTCVAWNASGELVLAGTSKGNLCLWNVDGKVLQVIETERNYEICALDWNPKEDEEVESFIYRTHFLFKGLYFNFTNFYRKNLAPKGSDLVGGPNVLIDFIYLTHSPFNAFSVLSKYFLLTGMLW